MRNAELKIVPFLCQGCQDDIKIPYAEGKITQCGTCGTYNILVSSDEDDDLYAEFHACAHGRNDDCPLCW